ncbi:MAG TPA: hypothetical protein VN736_09585 [Candidatus Limnocylindrales bacterium]|nr:hypothetical protein [Candidatus Limnocylindrales bacterium]
MDALTLSPALAGPAGLPAVPKTNDPAKIRDAAQQFEALLLNQVLQSSSENGWLGSGEDSSSACAGGLAQQQLATAMAKSGGIGLASLISRGLKTE